MYNASKITTWRLNLQLKNILSPTTNCLFHQHFLKSIFENSLFTKNTKKNFILEKIRLTHLYEKTACKKLVKMTQKQRYRQ